MFDILKACDYFESLDKDITDGWYPSIKELESHISEINYEKFLPLICYFSTNPLKYNYQDYKNLFRGVEDFFIKKYKPRFKIPGFLFLVIKCCFGI